LPPLAAPCAFPQTDGLPPLTARQRNLNLQSLDLPEEIEKLAYRRLPPEIREVEVGKDRPILRRRPPPKGAAKKR
jgi:hypothetical protein